MEKFKVFLESQGPEFLTGLVILLIGFYIARKMKKVMKKGFEKAGVDPGLTSFLAQIIYVLILMVVIMASLEKFGVKTTSLIAALGAAGFALGLALQGNLSNLASGIIILIFKPFRVGDFISMGTNSGTVREINMLNTLLTTPDNKKIVIPNSKLTSDVVINFTYMETRKLEFLFAISYENDIEHAKEVINDVLKAETRILEDPSPLVGVREWGDNSLNIAVQPWVKSEDYWPVYYEIMEKMKIAFDQNYIEIPYPQRVVTIKKDIDKI